jgi:hypothetical protein
MCTNSACKVRDYTKTVLIWGYDAEIGTSGSADPQTRLLPKHDLLGVSAVYKMARNMMDRFQRHDSLLTSILFLAPERRSGSGRQLKLLLQKYSRRRRLP